jgi:hypothetical protein
MMLYLKGNPIVGLPFGFYIKIYISILLNSLIKANLKLIFSTVDVAIKSLL